jgi:hypothetical protein
VELARGVREIVPVGAEWERLADVQSPDHTLLSLSRRDALATGATDGFALIVSGLTVAGVLAPAVGATYPSQPIRHAIAVAGQDAHLDHPTASELIADVFSAAREQSVLLITHRTEGLELVDRVVSLASPPPSNWIRDASTR